MDVELVRTLVNAGGWASMAILISLLHLYNVRVIVPEAQESFHEELKREREFWAAELAAVRTNMERRHSDLMSLLWDGRGCKWERDRHPE